MVRSRRYATRGALLAAAPPAPRLLRLRLGVGHPGEKHQVTNYVLKRGSADVEAAVGRNIDDAIDVMPELIDGNVNAAMKKLHTKDQP